MSDKAKAEFKKWHSERAVMREVISLHEAFQAGRESMGSELDTLDICEYEVAIEKLQDLEAKLAKAIEALTSIASLDRKTHDAEEYWLNKRSHEECSVVLATDTKIARQTLAQLVNTAGRLRDE